jgi:hypothetical protein
MRQETRWKMQVKGRNNQDFLHFRFQQNIQHLAFGASRKAKQP